VSCEGMQTLIQGYVDGELDLLGNLRAEEHLKDCTVCARDRQNHQALRLAFADGSLYFSAPATLRGRIRSAVRASGNGEPRPGPFSWRWTAAAVSFAVLAIAIWGLVLLRSSPARDDLLGQEIVAGHVRSMMAGHLTDVASSDQHTVKPWFDGRLDFAPPVKDLAPLGFPLVGGRLDYVGSRPVAALVSARQVVRGIQMRQDGLLKAGDVALLLQPFSPPCSSPPLDPRLALRRLYSPAEIEASPGTISVGGTVWTGERS
jgi:anti-sigma factor RsiW